MPPSQEGIILKLLNHWLNQILDWTLSPSRVGDYWNFLSSDINVINVSN